MIRQQLSPKALDIIRTLALVRVATSHQIERLHFTTGTSLSRVRMRNIALRKLKDLEVVARWRVPNGGLGGGSDPYYYALDRAGQMIAMPDKANYWREPYPEASFLKHRLAVTELYVTCRERSNDEWMPTLEQFEFEPTCWRRVATRYNKDHILRPDAFLVLANDGKRRPRFIEIDMGTERLERIGEKVKLYLDYSYLGREQERFDGLFPRVVFLVLDEDRKRRMEAYIRKLLHQLSPYRDLGPIFTILLQQDDIWIAHKTDAGFGSEVILLSVVQSVSGIFLLAKRVSICVQSYICVQPTNGTRVSSNNGSFVRIWPDSLV